MRLPVLSGSTRLANRYLITPMKTGNRGQKPEERSTNAKKTGNWTEYYKELRIYSKNLRIRDLVDSRLSIPNYVNTNQELINRIITEDRIIWAINTFKPLKSPGLDKIFPAMLQHSSETIVSLLCTLF